MGMITVVSPPAASDHELLARHAAGDREALEELFQRYRAVAYRVAYRLLGQEADALDAVQDGFVKALTHLGGFQGRSSFKTWLLRVVSNASLDFGRQRGRHETMSLVAGRRGDRSRIVSTGLALSAAAGADGGRGIGGRRVAGTLLLDRAPRRAECQRK